MKTKLLLPSERKSALQKLNTQLKLPKYKGRHFILLTEENVSEHCLVKVVSEVEALQDAELLEVEAGEKVKTLDIARELWEALISFSADRDCVLVLLGGGVLSDLGGFVAAAYKRGISYITIPTSLLGMVDAAIGGKTGVNMGVLKNQIGFFYPPELCCIHTPFLETLPEMDFFSGMGELMKTALLHSKETWEEFLIFLKSKEMSQLEKIINSSALFKEEVIRKDLLDSGIRKILNFGHTFGHAIESLFLQKDAPISHGHAVALGMLYEGYLSCKKLQFPQSDFDVIHKVVGSLFPVFSFTEEENEQLLSFMQHDKKNRDSAYYPILLQQIGKPSWDVPVSLEEMSEALREVVLTKATSL